MLACLYCTIVALNTVLVAIRKKSKTVLVITVLFELILMCGNNMNADYNGYQYFYAIQVYNNGMEWGYVILSKMAYALGLDYQGFSILIHMMGVIGINLIFVKLSENVHLVSLLYLTTLIFLDVVQIRQFLAYIIFTLAITCYCKNKKIYCFLLLIVGSLFHITVIVYLPLLLLSTKMEFDTKLVKMFFGIILMLCFFVFLTGSRLAFLDKIFSNFISESRMTYFKTRGRYGFIIPFMFQFICIYICHIIYKYYHNKSDDEARKKYINSVYVFILYSSIAMPLIMLNNNFYRFFKYGLISLFICVSNLKKDIDKARKGDNGIRVGGKYVIRKYGVLCICLLIILSYTCFMQSHSVVEDIFKHNMLIDYIQQF